MVTLKCSEIKKKLLKNVGEKLSKSDWNKNKKLRQVKFYYSEIWKVLSQKFKNLRLKLDKNLRLK